MSLARLSHIRHQKCRAEGASERSWFNHSVTDEQTEAHRGEGSGWPDLGLKPRALTPPISSPPLIRTGSFLIRPQMASLTVRSGLVW